MRKDQHINTSSLGTATTLLPNHTLLQFSDASAAFAGYINLADISLHKVEGSAAIPSTNPDQIVTIFESNNRVFRSDFPFSVLGDVTGMTLYFRHPIFTSNSAIHIPEFYVYAPMIVASAGPYKPDPTKSTDTYAIVPYAPSTSTIYRLYFSIWKLLAGANPWVLSSGANVPRDEGRGLLQVADIVNGHVISGKDVSIAGEVSSTKVPNQSIYSVRTDLDRIPRADLYAPTNEFCDITASNLVALGFTRGIRDTSTNPVYIRIPLTNARVGDEIAARCYVQSDIPDTFPTPKIAVTDWRPNALQQGSDFLFGRKISSTEADYFIRFRLTAAVVPDYVLIGLDTNANNSFYRVCGFQFGAAASAGCIDPIDYPRLDSRLNSATALAPFALQNVDASKAAVPDKLYLPANAQIPLNFASLYEKRTECAGVMHTLSFVNGTDAYVLEGQRSIILDTAKVPNGTLDFSIRDVTAPDYRQYKPIAVQVAPATVTASPKILCLADSLFEHYFVDLLNIRLTDVGMTPTFVGTVHASSIASQSDYGGPETEARGGKSGADYTNEKTDLMTPVAIGEEANYLAKTEVEKQGLNPTVRPVSTTITWTGHSVGANSNNAVAYSSQLNRWVLVGGALQTSDDGQTWTTRTDPAGNAWRSVVWAGKLGLFVAVASTGTGNRVITSPDGITWTARTSAADNSWYGLAWSHELNLLVATAVTGTGDRVMTSPDGVNWTLQTSPADNSWTKVIWAAELRLFVAVANGGTSSRVMTSPDGEAWTLRTPAAALNWTSIAWAPELGLLAAVATTGTGNRIMTSPDAITWTSRTSPADNSWQSICWSSRARRFIAVSATGTANGSMTSTDGVTWTTIAPASDISWIGIGIDEGTGTVVAVANSGANRVMTAKIDPPSSLFNGYVPDFPWYLDRFSLVKPDFVFLGHGTNDIILDEASHPRSQYQTWIKNWLSYLVPSMLAISPTVRIGVVAHVTARGWESDILWDYRHWMFREMIRYVRSLANTRVEVLPLWLHMSQETGWKLVPIGPVDDHTGLQKCYVSDTKHPDVVLRELCAKLATAWIASHV